MLSILLPINLVIYNSIVLMHMAKPKPNGCNALAERPYYPTDVNATQDTFNGLSIVV